MSNHRLTYAADRPKTTPPVPRGVYTGMLPSRGGMRVRLVDGLRVRDVIDVDFTMGGNPSRYAYVPLGEVWVDECLGDEDRLATAFHETVEHGLMQRGLSYDDAHGAATVAEKKFRARQVAMRGGHGRFGG